MNAAGEEEPEWCAGETREAFTPERWQKAIVFSTAFTAEQADMRAVFVFGFWGFFFLPSAPLNAFALKVLRVAV